MLLEYAQKHLVMLMTAAVGSEYRLQWLCVAFSCPSAGSVMSALTAGGIQARSHSVINCTFVGT